MLNCIAPGSFRLPAFPLLAFLAGVRKNKKGRETPAGGSVAFSVLIIKILPTLVNRDFI